MARRRSRHSIYQANRAHTQGVTTHLKFDRVGDQDPARLKYFDEVSLRNFDCYNHNAKIHHANAITPFLRALFQALNIKLVFLPTYSPELNPCELVFANVKQFMRAYRGNGTFLAEIYRGRAFANATDLQKVAAQYQRCIH
eukprot:g62770.t1